MVVKIIRNNYIFPRSIILSIVLHFLLLFPMMISFLYQSTEKKYKNISINNIEINQILKQPNHLYLQHHEQTKAIHHEQTKVTQNEQTKATQNEQTKATQNEQTKATQNEQTKATQNEQTKATQNEQTKATQNKQTKATQNKQTKATQNKQTKATQNKQTKATQNEQTKATQNEQTKVPSSLELDTILNNLINDNDKSKHSKNTINSYVQLDAYRAIVSNAISKKFYNASSFQGQTCELRIKLAPNGTLISVIPSQGNLELCTAAVFAAKQATIPQPPNKQVYEMIKDATISFLPE